MTNRLIRLGLAALIAAALPGMQEARAQSESNADDDSDPCADAESPCGAAEEETGPATGAGEEPGGAAGAGETPGGETSAASSTGPTLKEGAIALSASLQVGFSSDEVGGEAGNPLSIAPDVWYGINDHLSAGAVTSVHGVTGFWSGTLNGLAGTGLCLSGEPDLAEGVLAGCNGTFDNIGVEALYALKADPAFGLAIDAGFHALSLDPGEEIDPFIDAKLGARATWRTGMLAVGLAPSVFFALTERGDPPDGGGNDDLLFVPVDIGFQATSQLTIGVQSGIATPLQDMSEQYVVPVALGALFHINEKMMAAAAFSLDRVTGGTPEDVEDDASGAKLRSFSLVFGYLM